MKSFGAVDFLMNNAGRGGAGATLFGDPERWKAILDTNLWGVINGVQVFGSGDDRSEDAGRDRQHRIEAGDHLSARQHRLQCLEGRREGGDGGACPRASQHRRLPGHGTPPHPGLHLHRHHRADEGTEKPAGAWTAEQVIDFMLRERWRSGDFYILCPDNDVTRPMDEKRMRWAMDDIVLEPPRALALAPGLQGCVREIHGRVSASGTQSDRAMRTSAIPSSTSSPGKRRPSRQRAAAFASTFGFGTVILFGRRRDLDIDFEHRHRFAAVHLDLHLFGIDLHMLLDHRQDFLAEERDEVRAAGDGAFMREQDLQPIARDRRGRRLPEQSKSWTGSCGPPREQLCRTSSSCRVGMVRSTVSPARRRAASA